MRSIRAALIVGILLSGGSLFAQTADTLTITVQPATTPANAAFTITVEAQDSNMGFALDTTFTGTVNVAIASGPGALGGTTSLAATAGVASFTTLTLDTIGSVTIDTTSTGLAPDTTTAIAVTADRLIITAQPTDTRANATISTVTVAARDGNGNTDTSFTGNVTAVINSGTGSLTGGGATAAAGGVATFAGLSIDAVGAKTLDFTATGLTTATSNSFNITADRLVFTTQPASTTAGQTMANVVVEARDGLGTTDTNFTANIALTIASGTGTLNGTTTVAATAGVSTFSTLSINQADTFTLDADSAGLTTGTSGSFTISPDVDATLVFIQQPTNVMVSAVISPPITVQVRDQFGNPTTSTANVTLSINNNPGGATLGGTATQAAASGVATFNDITLNQAGTGYTLDANSGVLTGATSSAFNVSSTPTITVTAPNGGENLLVGANFNVTWGSSGSPGNVDIHLSTDGGSTFPVSLATNIADDGTETLAVPNNPSTQCRIRVRDNASGLIFDASDANFTIAVPAPAAVTMSASGNPGAQNANPGSTRTALGFRLTETGGGSTFTVTSVTVRVTTINNTGGVAVAAISSISLLRGSTVLGTQTSATWSVAADVITLNFTGLSSAIMAGSFGDFSVSINFAGTAVPTPRPAYVADIAIADVNGGTSVSGAGVTGGTITLAEQLPDDPLADDDDDDSCNLATRGGPAWPLLLAGLLVALVALRRRKTA